MPLMRAWGHGARRVAAQTGVDYYEALKTVHHRNAERSVYIRSYFHSEANVLSDWDLILNTDRIDPSHAIETIVAAMKGAGFNVPEGVAPVHAAAAAS